MCKKNQPSTQIALCTALPPSKTMICGADPSIVKNLRAATHDSLYLVHMERCNLQSPDINPPTTEKRRRVGHAEHRIQMQDHFIGQDPDHRLKRRFGTDGTNAHMVPPLQTSKSSQHTPGTRHATIPPPIFRGHGLRDPTWYGRNKEAVQTACICHADAYGRSESRT